MWEDFLSPRDDLPNVSIYTLKHVMNDDNWDGYLPLPYECPHFEYSYDGWVDVIIDKPYICLNDAKEIIEKIIKLPVKNINQKGEMVSI